MNLDLTKNEFKTLMEMAFVADWIIQNSKDEASEDAYAILRQKLLSNAKEFGCDHFVETDSETDNLKENDDFTIPLFEQYILQYETQSFWFNLASQLAIRDYEDKHGTSTIDFQLEKTKQDLDELENEYHKEFSTNGVNRLKIIEK
jgi:hypothetical protein